MVRIDDTSRVKTLKQVDTKSRQNVLYYTIRDQRVDDNWSFVYAQQLANQHESKLYMCFSLLKHYPSASRRHYRFILDGLKEVETRCTDLGASFHLLLGDPRDTLKQFIHDHDIGHLIVEQFPLKPFTTWIPEFCKFPVNLYQVDSHNLVPVWEASDKQEYAASTLRPKIHAKMNHFLTKFPTLEPCKVKAEPQSNDFDYAMEHHLQIDDSVPDLIDQSFYKGGYKAGMKKLDHFRKTKLKAYSEGRNKPTDSEGGTSRLSAWLHFGMISAQRVLLEIKEPSFVEELLVRRELSDNFCYYNPETYDTLKSCPQWAQRSQKDHTKETREKVYTVEELEKCDTEDPLWNASMKTMIHQGWLNGYLRMYWGKRFLTWSKTPEEAFTKAITLNNKYFMDGSDPNSYVSVLWCICALHDRAFVERPIYGKIRYMSFDGCKRKFNVDQYIHDTDVFTREPKQQKLIKQH